MATLQDEALGRSALRKASLRLLPLIGLGYGVAYMDRINISFAALQMNQDLKFGATVYGIGAGVFFLSYAALEIPSNLILARVGARRWIARIMVTWGLLAAGMMFVRTPLEFYAMRFLLGAAEAGFFPGVIYYLAQWFPSAHRGRAISRFYVAFPLAAVVMGTLAGALLGLNGRLGLAGWQWLFLAEGTPAVLLSLVVLTLLPDRPVDARWLSEDEKAWLETALVAEALAVRPEREPRFVEVLANPTVLLLGAVNFCFLGTSYAFTLSAPTILKAATHLSVAGVGYLTAAAGLAAAVAMITSGWLSDLTRERFGIVAGAVLAIALAFGLIAVSASPWVVAGAYALSVAGGAAMQGVFWWVPSTLLQGRSAAVGIAAINTIGMTGSFLAPMAWGVLRDHTGGYQLGISLLPIPLVIGATIMLVLRFMTRSTLAPLAMAAGAAAD